MSRPRVLRIDRANQVWATDITYIPMACGWVYLCAIVDWASRRVLAHRVSISMDASFCVEALEEAFAKYGKPEIFNSDQGSQLGFKESSQQVQIVSPHVPQQACAIPMFCGVCH